MKIRFSYNFLLSLLLSFGNLYLFGQNIESHKHNISDNYTLKSVQINYNYDLKFQRLNLTVDPAVRFVSGSSTFYYKTLQQIDTLFMDLSDSLKVDSVVKIQHLQFNQSNNLLRIKISSISNTLDSLTIYYSGVPSDSDYFYQGVHSDANSTPIISSFSEPYGAYSWMPCKQDLTDKIDSVEIIITSPYNYKTAANGILISDINNGVINISHWKHRHPIDYYLIAFSTTNYQVNNSKIGLNNGDSILITNYLYPESYNNEISKLTELQNVFQFFYDYAGEYPYKNEKYGHAQWSRGGGMEHQTMGFMQNLDFTLVVHELAHQWFGSKLSYSKGGLVLNSLRWEIGDSAFFEAIRNYLKDPLLINNSASTYDIKNHFEQSADTTLTEFFNDWIYGEGFPKYNFTWQQDSLNNLLLNVNQTTTHNSVNFYEMHLPIHVYGNNADTVLRLHNTYNNQTFKTFINFAIDSIKFNENYDIITKNASIIQNVTEIKTNNFVKIYPSPAKDFLTIEISNSNNEEINLKMLNINGSVIDEFQLKSKKQQIDVSKFAKGLYFIQIKGKTLNEVRKFEVQ